MVNQFEVFGEVFCGKARSEFAEITFLEVVRAADGAGDHTTSDRTVADHGNTKFAAGFEKTNLW
jgi:hypothetical protein